MSFTVTLTTVLIMLAYSIPGYLLVKSSKIPGSHIPSFAAVLLYLKVPYLHSAIAIVAILALVYFAFGKFLGVRLPVGTVIKALR